MKELELKINSLRESLKRPNEILMTYKQLSQEVINQEELVENITQDLSILRFRKAKQLDPWQLISNPTLDKQKVFPNKKNIVLIGFFMSLTFITLLSYLIEKKEGTLYEIKDIEAFFKEFPEEKRNRKRFKEKEILNQKALIYEEIFQKALKVKAACIGSIKEQLSNDLIKIIASNNNLNKFIKWKPKFNNLSKIVKSCIAWEKKIN